MPEGPEVRRHADELDRALSGKTIAELTARTKLAKAHLAENPALYPGKTVIAVRSHGKNLVGLIEGGHYFYTHLMMWGRWLILTEPPEARDRRERARITVADGTTAVLLSAPVFEVGETFGDPFAEHPYLRNLGPDILPYPDHDGFAASCFVERLTAPEHCSREIGAALLDQTIAAGIGNYLRAEILFVCGINPFRTVESLLPIHLENLCRYIPTLSERAYLQRGVTLAAPALDRIAADDALRYPNSKSAWGGGHYVFRRTNLPCVVCGTTIRQRRQVTYTSEEGEDRNRIIYFCPTCQGVAA
jgi:endonuclease-8